MDIQRSILIVALAVVSYLLVLQWNKDYGQPELPAASASMNTTQGLPDTPSASGTSSDVPTAQSSAAGSEAADKPVAVSDKLIQVKTDVLDLAIDPRGGDIVQLRPVAVSAPPGPSGRAVPAVRQRSRTYLPGAERPHRCRRPGRQQRRPPAVPQCAEQLPVGRRPERTGRGPELQPRRCQLHQALHLPPWPESRLLGQGKGPEEDRVHQ